MGDAFRVEAADLGTPRSLDIGEAMMFKVYAERCDQCLFSPDKIVSDARRREVLAECRRRDSHFVCHKASILRQDICCRGFYDASTSSLIRIAGRLGCIEFVPLPPSTSSGELRGND